MSSVQKDVQEEFMSRIPTFPKPEGDVTEVIYCHQYTKEIMDFATWDFLFFSKHCCRNGVTMHDPETPPKRILDIGCGNGLWVIEAAKLWKDCEVIGLDYLDNQPKPASLPKDLANRVQWVHANFLKEMPFPDKYFDIIHTARLAIHIPEDICPLFANDIYRILKPGGVLEATEEDIIFPHARILSPSRGTSQDFIREDIIFPYSPSEHTASCSRLSVGTITPDLSLKPGSDSLDTSSRLSDPLTPATSNSFTIDRRDHSQLSMAWDSMLFKRRVAPSGTAVLVFYLSSIFAVSQAPPALEIPLPANSFSRRDKTPEKRHPPDSMFYGVRKPTGKARPPPQYLGPKVMSTLAPMHLARTVATVVACKDTLRESFIEIFLKDYPPPPKSVYEKKAIDPLGSVRDAFEEAWTNWEGDMKDRINSREMIRAQLQWVAPKDSESDWRDWRQSVLNTEEDQSTDDLCRNVRSFVGWKPME